MKRLLKKLLHFLMTLFPSSDTIILESSPDLSDNTYPIYQELLKARINERFRLLWLVNSPEKYRNIKIRNVSFASSSNEGVANYIKRLYRVSTAKVIIFSNKRIPKERKQQYSLFVSHGTTTKKNKGIYELNNMCDEFLVQSQFFKPMIAYEHSVDIDRLISLGFPRNDALFTDPRPCPTWISPLGCPYIVWMPTYRQHKKYSTSDGGGTTPYGIPVIQDTQEMTQLNEALTKAGYVLVAKLHPAQAQTQELIGFDHIVKIDDGLLSAHDLGLYDFIGGSSALITDYSSILYDYLLTERPMAVTMDDFEIFKAQRGLSIENYEELVKALSVVTTPELLRFIQDLGAGNDPTLARRKELKVLFNDYVDNGSAKRVTQHILDEIDRRFPKK